jgi:AraC-like DNA-binding protein
MPSIIISSVAVTGAPDESTHDHKHNTCRMIYVKRGWMRCVISGERIEASAPCIVFIGNSEPHFVTETSHDYTRHVITLDPFSLSEYLSPNWLASVFFFHSGSFTHLLPLGTSAREAETFITMLTQPLAEHTAKRSPEGEALLVGAFLYRLSEISPRHFASREFGRAELIVSEVMATLERAPEKKLDLNSLASRHRVSRYYLAHIFKSLSGYTLSEYLGRARISLATELLLNERELSVSEIAQRCGFRDASNFSRYFKRALSCTPTEFRGV